MSNWFQWGQKAANNGKTAAPPKGTSPSDAQKFQQGHNSQQNKNGKG